jgi:protein TonB
VIRRPWLGLALSVALHAGALALVLVVVSRDEPLPALMIDLRDPFVPGAASGAPSVATPPREERPAPSSPSSQPKRSRSTVAGKTVPAAPQATPQAPSAPTSSPAPVIEASPPPPIAETPREPAPAAPQGPPAPPPSREVVEARPSASLAPAATAEPNPRAAGGSTVAGSVGGTTAAGNRGVAGDGSTALDRSGRGEATGSPGPRVASAPSSGVGSGAGAEYGPYLTALRQRIQESVRYPSSARRRGLAGTVSVEILILANGTIGDVTLLESSTHQALDDAALETIRALPRMPLPPGLPARALKVRVPVVFQMR